MGLRGNLPIFISKFLENRSFKVRLGSSLSDTYEQEVGVPQGSILSVSLFSIKISNIANSVLSDVESSLFVDDLLIYSSGPKLPLVERRLQLTLNKIQTWALQNGFKFSKTKTTCMHLCNLRKCKDNPSLTIDGSAIPLVAEARFLRLIFDRKLSFIPHLRDLRTRCRKSLDALKIVANSDWGADRKTLLTLYRALVRSKLDYGLIVYGSARPSYLKMLDSVHHSALRICLGSLRTSPIESLYIEADEPSLNI